ncbi:MAG: hypothetical protein R6U37_07820 [Dehalococcoidia bacterium]
MKQIAALVLIVLFALIAPGTAAAQGASTGVISGEVVNGTEGSGVSAGQQVWMLIYEDDVLVETETAETDDEGRFEFPDVSTEPEYQYMFHINYGGVDYYAGEWISFADDSGSKSAVIHVCEPTASDETIKVSHAHTIISIDSDSLEVSESFLFSNYGDRTYVGQEKYATSEGAGVLIFNFPARAQVSTDFFDSFILLDEVTFADPLPFPPATRQVDYSYRLPVEDARDCVLDLHINYPTDTFRVMVEDGEVEVSGNQLIETEKIETQEGERFIQLVGENLSQGDLINIDISPAPGKINWTTLILWLIAGLFVIAFVVFLLKLGRRRAKVIASHEADDGSSQTAEQQLLAEIAQLDDDFEQGVIGEANYRQARAQKKAQLLEMKRRQG